MYPRRQGTSQRGRLGLCCLYRRRAQDVHVYVRCSARNKAYCSLRDSTISHHSLSPSVMLRQAMRDTNIRSLQFCSIRIGEVVADVLTRLILSRHEQGNSIQSIKFLRCRLEELEDPIPLMTALRTVERIEFGWSSPIRFLSYCLSESFPSTSPQADTDKTAVERIPSETEDCCGISTLVLREAHIVDPMASGYPTFPSSTINQDEVTIYHVVK